MRIELAQFCIELEASRPGVEPSEREDNVVNQAPAKQLISRFGKSWCVFREERTERHPNCDVIQNHPNGVEKMGIANSVIRDIGLATVAQVRYLGNEVLGLFYADLDLLNDGAKIPQGRGWSSRYVYERSNKAGECVNRLSEESRKGTDGKQYSSSRRQHTSGGVRNSSLQ